MLKKGWVCKTTQLYFPNRYKSYKITSPNGNIYKLHNSDDFHPMFYMETDEPGRYTYPVGRTFHETLKNLYKMEDERIFRPMKEIYEEQIYKHCYSRKMGYSLEKIDTTSVFHKDIKLLHLYSEPPNYFVYSTSKDIFQATEILAEKIVDQMIHNNQTQQIQSYLLESNDNKKQIEDILHEFSTILDELEEER